KVPSPQPSPAQGRERIAADFAVAGGLKSNLDLPLISGRMKNKKQPAQAVLVCINLNPNSHPVLSPVGEGWREGSKPQGLYFRRLREFGKDCRNSENALSPALPHGGGSGLRQILRLQAV
ncbi:hypothetical protein AAD070_002172, partial [Neisseria gonorrhoeae]